MANKMFIEVTSTNGSKLKINVNHIIHFFSRGTGEEEFTAILLSNDKTIHVREKYSEIKSKINALV